MNRLLQIILSTEFDSTDCIRDTGIICHDNKWNFHLRTHHPFQKTNTITFRQTYVSQYKIDFVFLQNTTCTGFIYSCQYFVTGLLQPFFNHSAKYHIVFNYQNFHIFSVHFLFH